MAVLWTASEIIQTIQAVSFPQEPAPVWEATGLSIDSRTTAPGDLFFALTGPRIDGHQFIHQAFLKGAVAAVVHSLDLPSDGLCSSSAQGHSEGMRLLLVPNTLQALQHLAVQARRRTSARIGAITGSFGKTSCKEALKWVLSRQGALTTSAQSFNNHFGVPVSLALLRPDDHFGIFEVGTNHPGEIAPLSDLIRPHVALITNVEEMHRANFLSLESICEEKSSIFHGMSAGGIAVLNQDNPMFKSLKKQASQKGLSVLSFGSHLSCDLRLEKTEFQDGVLYMTATFLGEKLIYTMNVLSPHWGLNSLGILGMIHSLGGNVGQAAQDLRDFSLPPGRGAIVAIPVPGGWIKVLDESYNAGPLSMKAALKALANAKPGPQGRRIAVLGDMLELGDESQTIHKALCEDIITEGIDLVFTSGVLMKSLFDILPLEKRGGHEEDPVILGHQLVPFLKPGDILMIKGSRGHYHSFGRMQNVLTVLAQSQETLATSSFSKTTFGS